jgi:uncharacterized protein YecE (DUF72 family)
MGAELRVGTCSWKYPSWKGLVYSQTGADYLAEYAARYNTVEVDQWFWAPPEPVTAQQYNAATPDDFRFTVKLPNALSLTHFYPKKGETGLRENPQFLSVPVFEDTLSRLAPLAPKIGMLMLQFEYLNRQKMESQEDLLRHLGRFFDAVPRSLPIAVEPRNPRWLDERYFTFLAQRGLSHVFLHGYYMAPAFDTWRTYGHLCTGAAVVRLHGPDRDGMEKLTGERWDRIVAPKDDELDRLVDMVREMREKSLTVYLNINNHFEGSAPLTIERLRARGLFDGA